MKTPLKIITIVPAYNEQMSIENTVNSLQSLKPSMRNLGYDFKVYVVNDGSTDDTMLLARNSGADKVVDHKVNRGLGAAVRSGLLAAHTDEADIAIKFDADLQHDPEDIKQLIKPIVADAADIVYGNRFERIEYQMPFVRKIGNRVFIQLMRWLTGWPLKDSQPGIFAVGKRYLGNMYLPGNYNYTQQILLDAYQKGMRFEHVSVAFRKRTTGKSFVSFKYPFKVLPQILMVLIGVRPLHVFGPIGLIFLSVASIIFGVEFTAWLLGYAAKPVAHVNAVLGLSLFGIQTIFFGLLAHLIVELDRRRNREY